MTIQPEMRFRCDRCKAEVNVAFNEQPGSNRAQPPEGWMVLWIESTTGVATHLCLPCKLRFEELMMRNPA